MLESLKDKQCDLKKINRDIVELLSEDELENEVTQSDETDMNIRLGIQKISKELKTKKAEDKELESNTAIVKTPGMKLLKFTLTAFNGDPLKWTCLLKLLMPQLIHRKFIDDRKIFVFDRTFRRTSC